MVLGFEFAHMVDGSVSQVAWEVVVASASAADSVVERGRAAGKVVVVVFLGMGRRLNVEAMAQVFVRGSRRAGIVGVGLWWRNFEGGFGSILVLSFLRIYYCLFALWVFECKKE